MDSDKQFAELVLDDDSLHTPAGSMPLSEITRAEFVRKVASDGPGPSTQQSSVPATVGGAIVGGALLGGAGAVVGGLLGSRLREDAPGVRTWHTESVRVFFETDDLAYSADVSRDQEVQADRFAAAVRKAAKDHR